MVRIVSTDFYKLTKGIFGLLQKISQLGNADDRLGNPLEVTGSHKTHGVTKAITSFIISLGRVPWPLEPDCLGLNKGSSLSSSRTPGKLLNLLVPQFPIL